MTRRSAALVAPLTRLTAHILVVEDDQAIQALLHRLLREAGYTTSGCRAAQDAQYLIATEHPDLLIVDIHLLDDRAGGWEVLSLARLVPATMALPIIVCSADATFLNAKRQELRELGCWTIAKPFDIGQLLQTVATALDAPRHDEPIGA
jgi:DNA-binding response OmpR family regulator